MSKTIRQTLFLHIAGSRKIPSSPQVDRIPTSFHVELCRHAYGNLVYMTGTHPHKFHRHKRICSCERQLPRLLLGSFNVLGSQSELRCNVPQASTSRQHFKFVAWYCMIRFSPPCKRALLVDCSSEGQVCFSFEVMQNVTFS